MKKGSPSGSGRLFLRHGRGLEAERARAAVDDLEHGRGACDRDAIDQIFLGVAADLRAGRTDEYAAAVGDEIADHVAYRGVERIRAMLVKSNGARYSLDGEVVEDKTERKSFFRRLAEKNGSPAIDWEDVLILKKPEAAQ